MKNITKAGIDWNNTREYLIENGSHVKLDGDIDFYHLIDSETLHIFCEESDGRKDWRTNLKAFPLKRDNNQSGWVYYHPGFYYSANKIFNSILKLYPVIPKNIKISGYSLGAAESSIIIDKLYCLGIEVDCHITFGEPANAFIFANRGLKLNRSKSKRYVQGKDLVSRIVFYLNHYSKKIKLPSIGASIEDHDYYWLKDI